VLGSGLTGVGPTQLRPITLTLRGDIQLRPSTLTGVGRTEWLSEAPPCRRAQMLPSPLTRGGHTLLRAKTLSLRGHTQLVLGSRLSGVWRTQWLPQPRPRPRAQMLPSPLTGGGHALLLPRALTPCLGDHLLPPALIGGRRHAQTLPNALAKHTLLVLGSSLTGVGHTQLLPTALSRGRVAVKSPRGRELTDPGLWGGI